MNDIQPTYAHHGQGFGPINLMLAVLLQAKQDAVNGWPDTELWHTFQENFNIANPHQDAEGIANWVVEFILDARKTETL